MADLTGMMQAAAGAAGEESLFIEDVFSTFLYTGTGAALTITNDINLNGKGGLVWIKSRSAATDHQLFDTERGATKELISNSTAAEAVDADTLTGFNANGFALGADSNVNTSAATYCSWTFRKAPKFFDVVTYTGTGANRTVAHNLGSVPGSIWVKRTDTTGDWQVYHRANTAAPETDFLVLNSTAATVDSNTRWNDTLPTDTVFTVGTEATVNASGGTYVAYLWAHDDGGFGDDGLQNVVTCGAFTTDGSGNATVTLGYEPQWVLYKRTVETGSWVLIDVMRGNSNSSNARFVLANTADAESSVNWLFPTATGFTGNANSIASVEFLFIAIRRGPMKTPTAGTEVFAPVARSGTGANDTVSGGPTADAVLVKNRGSAVASLFAARLTATNYLVTSTPAAQEAAGTTILQANPWDVMDGVKVGTTSDITNASGNTFINYLFSRAPVFFDVVCYTGNGTAGRTVAHNLGVIPDLTIFKQRTFAGFNWVVKILSYWGTNQYLILEGPNSVLANNSYIASATDSLITLTGTAGDWNRSGDAIIAYLFASLAGVQDIGSYTGNGTSLTVTTGFQPRFIIVKRTDSNGNWIVGDSSRGLPAGDDPFFRLNTDAAEITNQDWVDVSATGFTVNQTGANANVSTGVYLYWVIS